MTPNGLIATSATWRKYARKRKRNVKLKLKDAKLAVLGYGGRDFQVRVFNGCRGKKNALVKSPTGSGKSLIIEFLAIAEVVDSNWTRKQLIAVPQLNISGGFVNFERFLLDGNEIEFKAKDFCNKGKESVSDTINFLLEGYTYTNDRKHRTITRSVAVCSHAALIAAFSKMTPQQCRRAIASTTISIDEFHHISMDDVQKNRLGHLVEKIEAHDGAVRLSSATPFRGDGQRTIRKDYIDKFHIESVSLVEYLATTGIETLKFDFVSYEDKNDVMDKVMKTVLAERKEPTIIIVPSEGQKFFNADGDKGLFVKKLITMLKKEFGDDQVLDFVTKKTQKSEEAKFLAGQKFHILVTCAKGREGMDWPRCSRIHNLTFDRSILLQLQKFGRILRDFDGKTKVLMYNYIPAIRTWSTEEMRERVSDYLNAVIGSAVIDDQLHPLTAPVFRTDGTPETVRRATLDEIYPEDCNTIDETIVEEFCKLTNDEKEDHDIIDSMIAAVIAPYNKHLNVHDEDIIDMIRQRLIRMLNPRENRLRIPGVLTKYIREMGWDKVVRKYIAGHSFFSADTTQKEIEVLAKFLKTTREEHFKEMMRLAKKYGGVMGGLAFLRKNMHKKEEWRRLYAYVYQERAKLKNAG